MLTLWYFLRHRGAISRVSRSSVDRFFDGKGALPRATDGFVYYAQAIVELENRKAKAVSWIAYGKAPALKNGHIDKVAWRSAGSAIPVPPQKIGNFIDATETFAQRRRLRQTQWTPTAAEVQRIHALINERAKATIIR